MAAARYLGVDLAWREGRADLPANETGVAVIDSRGPHDGIPVMSTVPATRLAVWEVTETGGVESAWLTLDGLALTARGRAAGQRPGPYWLAYDLDTDDMAATTRSRETVETPAGSRHADMRRGPDGWTLDGQQPRPDLAGALDCDLECCPVTNTMPVLRHGLHLGPGRREFTMAFVSVPSLEVVPVRQSYQHLGAGPGGTLVRYQAGSFSQDLTFDSGGLVLDYPTMARRILA